jgi:hypothetical protein
MTTKPTHNKIFKGILCRDEEDKCNHENMGKINLTTGVGKQMKRRKQLNTKTNGRNCYILFNINTKF